MFNLNYSIKTALPFTESENMATYLVQLSFVLYVAIGSVAGNCLQGYHMDYTSKQCKPCPDGSYSTVPNLASECQPCKQTCDNPSREEINVTCSSTTDNTCICKKGYFDAELISSSLVCVERNCPPGQQEVNHGKYLVYIWPTVILFSLLFYKRYFLCLRPMNMYWRCQHISIHGIVHMQTTKPTIFQVPVLTTRRTLL